MKPKLSSILRVALFRKIANLCGSILFQSMAKRRLQFIPGFSLITIPLGAGLSTLLLVVTIHYLNPDTSSPYPPSKFHEIISLENDSTKVAQSVDDRKSGLFLTNIIRDEELPGKPTSKSQTPLEPNPSQDQSSPPPFTPIPPSPQTPQWTEKLLNHHPKIVMAPAHPTNFGDRLATDIQGKLVNNQPIVVLHETVGSAQSAINFFQTPHPNEDMQASYHAIVSLSGTIFYTVPPEKRAFGAGNSAFRSKNGLETVQTNPKISPSVNNFAYHISLETPLSGRNNNNTNHSGYTQSQYLSLAWLIVQTQIPLDRITTHKAVDQSASRMDPRSFSFKRLMNLLQAT
ncbi:MAG: peptidoglycan recognition family protein [Synechococcales cyanobacterium]